MRQAAQMEGSGHGLDVQAAVDVCSNCIVRLAARPSPAGAATILHTGVCRNTMLVGTGCGSCRSPGCCTSLSMGSDLESLSRLRVIYTSGQFIQIRLTNDSMVQFFPRLDFQTCANGSIHKITPARSVFRCCPAIDSHGCVEFNPM